MTTESHITQACHDILVAGYFSPWSLSAPFNNIRTLNFMTQLTIFLFYFCQPADRKNTETDKVDQNLPITAHELDLLALLSQMLFSKRSTVVIDGSEKRLVKS